MCSTVVFGTREGDTDLLEAVMMMKPMLHNFSCSWILVCMSGGWMMLLIYALARPAV